MKKIISVIIFLFWFVFYGFGYDTLVLKNVTILNSENFGKSCSLAKEKTIILKNGKICRIGNIGELNIPKNSKILDLKGKFAVPGLIDGFAAINNQSYANAYLYSGITSIIAVGGGRRGILYEKANPSPTLYKLEGLGDEKISNKKIVETLCKFKSEDYKVALLMYKLTPEQLKFAVKKAHSLGLSTIGELGFTDYFKAIDYGVDAFVHTTRYSLFLADEKMRESVAKEPFSDDLNSPKWKYYKWLSKLNLKDKNIMEKIKKFGAKHPILIPTFGLLYLDIPGHKNPWKERISLILNPEDINNPADKKTGKHNYDKEHQKAYTDIALKEYELEKAYYKAGAHYLSGSGTDVWGSMPGIFLHYELQSLKKIGLSNCEVISAATSNFSDVFGWKTGKLKEGFAADILILNKNPLNNLSNLKDIFLLIHNGKIIDREKLLKEGE